MTVSVKIFSILGWIVKQVCKDVKPLYTRGSLNFDDMFIHGDAEICWILLPEHTLFIYLFKFLFLHFLGTCITLHAGHLWFSLDGKLNTPNACRVESVDTKIS